MKIASRIKKIFRSKLVMSLLLFIFLSWVALVLFWCLKAKVPPKDIYIRTRKFWKSKQEKENCDIYLEEGSNYTILWWQILTPYFYKFFFLILKFKQTIRTVQHNLHIKMCLETKFYIFFGFSLLFIKMCTKLLFSDNCVPLKAAILNFFK